MAKLKEISVKAMRIIAVCEACGGALIYKDIILPTDPPRYSHICPNCGTSETLSRAYPLIEYRLQ